MTTPEGAGLIPTLDVSFVLIGYNEGPNIEPCVTSVRRAELPDRAMEVIYVDGGSTDESRAIAARAGADRVLGGDTRRRAAENRNAGAHVSRGRFIQFVDGDMQLEPDWPAAAMAFLELHPDVAAVYGKLRETHPGYLFQVVQLDWNSGEGPAPSCGGAAMWRRDVFEQSGGFPEDVRYGEEPLLCWRVRNDAGRQIYSLDRWMAQHDLGFRGFRDYLRQYVRNGASYAEIAARCIRTNEPMWLREVISNYVWAAAVLLALILLVFAATPVRAGIGLLALGIWLRKTIQTRRKGHSWEIAMGYAVHTYLSKLPLAFGQLQWLLGRLSGAR